MKNIIYLFGAGATQAVIKDINSEKSLMTEDIRSEIHKKFRRTGIPDQIWNALMSENYDIEQIISMLESTYNFSLANKIREFYQKSLIGLVREFSENLPSKNLYSVLSDLHANVKPFKEEEKLLCYITLNYEDLLEKSIKKHLERKIDYNFGLNNNLKDKFNIIKLHGSFSWENSRPIKIRKLTRKKNFERLWIPPGIDKEKGNYPFNLLWGKVEEYLMECDVLRIIGCSLSRNDWNLIPILYTVQDLSTKKKRLEIEIIDFPKTFDNISDTYNYLNLKCVTTLPEVIFYYNNLFPKINEQTPREELDSLFTNNINKSNPFKQWLEMKIEYFMKKSNYKDIKTKKNFVYNFYNKE